MDRLRPTMRDETELKLTGLILLATFIFFYAPVAPITVPAGPVGYNVTATIWVSPGCRLLGLGAGAWNRCIAW
jgi:hypothetical protein